ncbi:MAG: lysine--tRNA ligase [Candidatus Pacebacteria bacterium]|nr:lysine--tRNA ligase [Candidatus Paceibacterota bacterium]
MASLDEIRQTRLEKKAKLEKNGVNPYPSTVDFDCPLQEALAGFSEGREIKVVGRIMSLRSQGALVFFDLNDGTEKMQALLKKAAVSEKNFQLFSETVDIGDFISVQGKMFLTKKGEKTVAVSEWRMLAKSLRPLPEKWHGIKDTEERYRKRYLDILFNPKVREMIEKKAVFWNAVREFHIGQGFLEVTTPVLENTVGGADARPFVTHHNALDMDVYLRISAGELWQKRLIIAGFEKTFEIGRIFRNEGMSAEHSQDYTQCEAYWAYSDYKDMYKFLRDCYCYVAEKTFGTLKFEIGKFKVDLGGNWPLLDYKKEVERQTGINIWEDDSEKIIKKLEQLKIKFDTADKGRLVDILWKYCRKNIEGPAILVNEPKITSPLAKISPDNPETVMRFHFIIAGSEVGQGYSELNDPIDQKERFQIQQNLRDAGDEEAQMMDEEFVEALEYGMPPTSGHGFSERLFWILSDISAREGALFPLMRPKE